MKTLPEVATSSAGYLVCKGDSTLYWGYSKHVARLIALVCKADYIG